MWRSKLDLVRFAGILLFGLLLLAFWVAVVCLTAGYVVL